MTAWFRDGQPCDTISPGDRGVSYGDGLFETIAIRGGAPRLWHYHVERLQTGAARIGLAAPDAAVLRSELEAALEHVGTASERCVAKILLTAGTGPRGYRREPDAPATLLTGIADARNVADAGYREGVDVRLCNTSLSIQPQLAGLKTLNRLEQVLARNEWSDETVFEGLTLDTEGRVICGTMSNVFLVNGQQLTTPALTRCGVSGVMRRHLLSLADNAGIDCRVCDVELDELWGSDGVFLSNSQFGILPVRRCGAHSWKVPNMFQRFAAMLKESGVAEGPA